MYSFNTLVAHYFLALSSSPFPVIASQKRGNLGGWVFLEIAELVPSVSEESRSEFASATPRKDRKEAPRKDTRNYQSLPRTQVEEGLTL